MFKGKTIIITGASSGLGKELCRRLAQKGANLALIARNREKLTDVKKELESIAGQDQKIESISCDVTDFNRTEKAFEQMVDTIGVPDILINNAGILEEGYFENISLSIFREIFDVNFFGAINCTKIILPYFKSKGTGKIVNVASLGGKMASFGYSAYCSSKYALVGLTETLRMELKPQNISVNLVCPGEFNSPMVDKLNTYRTKENIEITHTAPVLSIDFVADEIIAGIEKNRFLIIPGRISRILERIGRWFPSVLRAVVDFKVNRIYQGPIK